MDFRHEFLLPLWIFLWGEVETAFLFSSYFLMRIKKASHR
jgi:hypothetical protein